MKAPSGLVVQRLAWEQFVLGLPISVHPLAVVADHLPEHVSLMQLPGLIGQPVTVAGFRLSGWTGRVSTWGMARRLS